MLALARAFEQSFDVGLDALGDGAASAGGGMDDMPFDALLARHLRWHAMGPVPFPVQGHGRDPLPYIALTMFSVTFLASPSSIMVLSR